MELLHQLSTHDGDHTTTTLHLEHPWAHSLLRWPINLRRAMQPLCCHSIQRDCQPWRAWHAACQCIIGFQLLKSKVPGKCLLLLNSRMSLCPQGWPKMVFKALQDLTVISRNACPTFVSMLSSLIEAQIFSLYCGTNQRWNSMRHVLQTASWDCFCLPLMFWNNGLLLQPQFEGFQKKMGGQSILMGDQIFTLNLILPESTYTL